MLYLADKLFRNKDKGFTLVELMVVVVIIGILVAIIIPIYGQVQNNSALRSHEANLRTIDGAISMFEAETGVFPSAYNNAAHGDIGNIEDDTHDTADAEGGVAALIEAELLDATNDTGDGVLIPVRVMANDLLGLEEDGVPDGTLGYDAYGQEGAWLYHTYQIKDGRGDGAFPVHATDSNAYRGGQAPDPLEAPAD
jgi:prepilin-type N-terminal cleavage/methylation domain-containing protein